jgi:hypothetical protein
MALIQRYWMIGTLTKNTANIEDEAHFDHQLAA